MSAENNEFILLRSILLERHARMCVEAVYEMQRILDAVELDDVTVENRSMLSSLRNALIEENDIENLAIAFHKISGYDINHLIPKDVSLEEMVDIKNSIKDVGLRMIEISENVLFNRS